MVNKIRENVTKHTYNKLDTVYNNLVVFQSNRMDMVCNRYVCNCSDSLAHDLVGLMNLEDMVSNDSLGTYL